MKSKLSIIILVTFFSSSIFANNEKKSFELQCAQMSVQLATNSLKSAEKYKDSFESIENIKLMRLGIKPIANIYETNILSKSFHIAFVDYLKTISDYQKSGKSYDEIRKLNSSFLEKLLVIIKKDSPDFFKGCMEYTTRIAKNCNDYANNEKKLQSCIRYEAKGRIEKINVHFQKTSLVEVMKKAKNIEKKISKAIEKDNLKDFSQLVENRLALYGINLYTIMPKIYRELVEKKAKQTFGLIKSAKFEHRKETYAQFVKADYLLKLAIENKANEQLNFFLDDKAYPLSKVDLNDLIEYAKSYKNWQAIKILVKAKT